MIPEKVEFLLAKFKKENQYLRQNLIIIEENNNKKLLKLEKLQREAKKYKNKVDQKRNRIMRLITNPQTYTTANLGVYIYISCLVPGDVYVMLVI